MIKKGKRRRGRRGRGQIRLSTGLWPLLLVSGGGLADHHWHLLHHMLRLHDLGLV